MVNVEVIVLVGVKALGTVVQGQCTLLGEVGGTCHYLMDPRFVSISLHTYTYGAGLVNSVSGAFSERVRLDYGVELV